MGKWYETSFDDQEVVLQSRIRLSRNIKQFLFSEKLAEEDAKELVNRVFDTVSLIDSNNKYTFTNYPLMSLQESEKKYYLESDVLTLELLAKNQSTGLLLSEDESVAVMVNGEDHLCIQSVCTGNNIVQAYQQADKFDHLFNKTLSFAFDEKFGYLTSSLSNVGTGLRASFLIFLPALTMAGKIQKLSEEIGKYGVSIRNVFEEENKNHGSLYMISNQKTLGMQESEILDNLTQIMAQIEAQEKKRREYILSINGEEIEDKVYRSYGVLKYAKKICFLDALTLLAQLQFGISCGLLKVKQSMNLYQIMIEIQPFHLQKMLGKKLLSTERDKYRAAYLSSVLPELELPASDIN